MFRDGYEDADEALIFELFGETPVARWPFAENIYAEAGANATLRLYEGVGHKVTKEINEDIREFFESVLDGKSE